MEKPIKKRGPVPGSGKYHTRFNFRIDSSLYDLLKDMADKTGKSVGKIIRDILDQALDKQKRG